MFEKLLRLNHQLGGAPAMKYEDFFGADDEIVYAVYDGMAGSSPSSNRLLDKMSDLSGFDTSHKVQDLIEQYLESRRGQDHYGDLNRREYIEHLYDEILDRPSDAGGFAYWLDQMRNGSDRAEIAMQFILSDEHMSTLKSVFAAGDVARLYYGLLDRAPDAEGLHYFRDTLGQGNALPDVAQVVLNSAEYLAKHAGLSDTAYVQSLYEHALGRQAEQEGLDYWDGRLEQGASRAWVASAITDSAEAHHHLAIPVADAWHL
ncbi:DUF4214 domain-containing protein [Methylobacterium durans]|uniref:DUF4214 domain-containing protein n=1 Tax=Methylobacterium durans TaxID=2202825 RepID=UPI002AFF7865|nr:DUF4214 domain-containing protein [Methylobacterium durans]MEA1832186.1 DUF4214 domain-containing protein [Methylobacterium durans]